MKKLTALLLIVLLICSTMIGCNQEDIPGGESTENEPYESTDPFIEDSLDDYDKEESQHGFTIKGEKFDRTNNDNNVLILEVENTTQTHYTATFDVTFYDDAGEIVATQKKTIQQFPAKKKQACVFDPYEQFASYTCELSLEEYTDVDYLSTLSCGKQISKAKSFVSPLNIEQPFAHISVRMSGSLGASSNLTEGKVLGVYTDMVVFDNTGKIYSVIKHGLTFMYSETTVTASQDVPILRSTTDLNLQIPEELTGDLTVIVAPTNFYIKDFT